MLKRKYDIGSGFTLEDDGHYITARREMERGSSSIGCKRPYRVPKSGSVLKVQCSLDGCYMYLPDFAEVHGFWISTKTWESVDAMKADSRPGIMGTEYASLKDADGKEYFREVLRFTFWKVKSKKETEQKPFDDPVAKDYFDLAAIEFYKQVARFDEFIADSGRTLESLIGVIGYDFVPVQELPVVAI